MFKEKIKIKTRDFGQIEVDRNDEIYFTTGMYGFENYNSYVILKESPGDDIMFLQSLDNTDLSFVLVDPYSISVAYEPCLFEEDLKDLEVDGEIELKFLAIAIIKENIKDSVVNLKSPIALNPKTRRAKQVILQNTYPLRYKLVAAEEDEKC